MPDPGSEAERTSRRSGEIHRSAESGAAGAGKQSARLRAEEREKQSQRELTGRELARLEERKANLQKEYDEIISRLWEEYELTRRQAEETVGRIEEPGKAQKAAE